MPDLVAILRRHPLTAALKIEDRRVAGRPGRTLTPIGQLEHHTVSRAGSGNMPSLHTVTVGRPDVAGPLSNVLTGRDGTVAVITDGSANHSGAGNAAAFDRLRRGFAPFDLPPGTPDDRGHISDHTIGNEIENNGTGEPYPPEQIDAVDRVAAAFADHFGYDPATALIGHKEWTARKIDPSFDMDAHRRRVAALLEPTPPPAPPAPTPKDDTMIVARKPGDTRIYALAFPYRRQVTSANAAELIDLHDLDGVAEISGNLLAQYLDVATIVTAADVEAALDAAGVDVDVREQVREILATAAVVIP